MFNPIPVAKNDAERNKKII